MISRRHLTFGAALMGLGGFIASSARAENKALSRTFATIEEQYGRRLGVAVFDTHTGMVAMHRSAEAFPMCSTFKLLAAAAVLQRVDNGTLRLDHRIQFDAANVVDYSPATKDRAGGEGMTLAELCDAAVTLSDNTAGNLLLAVLDGPRALTAFARSIGDQVTRLDRIEPHLNEATPGDPRDTTLPSAMVMNLDRLLVGDALKPPSRRQLMDWMLASKTGDTRLRARLPNGWQVGDKTGSGAYGTTNDIGFLRREGRGMILVAAYLTQIDAPPDRRNAVIAAVGRAVVDAAE